MNLERVASLLVTAFQLVLAWKFGGAKMLLILLAFDIVLLAEIWFSEAMGDYFGGRITTKSPAVMVKWAGWIFLVGLTILLILGLGIRKP